MMRAAESVGARQPESLAVAAAERSAAAGITYGFPAPLSAPASTESMSRRDSVRGAPFVIAPRSLVKYTRAPSREKVTQHSAAAELIDAGRCRGSLHPAGVCVLTYRSPRGYALPGPRISSGRAMATKTSVEPSWDSAGQSSAAAVLIGAPRFVASYVESPVRRAT